ncbi:RuvX/YqgF family protein [Candidatus Saccharibacteria bacterium]|nr:RuvX/YqgF family protein [Candidatus Saccharibacteria bacterium]
MNSGDFGGGVDWIFSATVVEKIKFRDQNHEFNAIGIDVGEKNIGLASGNSRFSMAFPLMVLPNNPDVYLRIFTEAYQKTAQVLVIGLPRNSDGQETKQSQVVRNFAKKLQKTINDSTAIVLDDSGESGAAEVELQITFQDESLTSVIAEKHLRDQKNFTEKMLRDGTLDMEAATIILEDFLNNHRQGTGR